MASWQDVIVSSDTTLGDAIKKVDASGLQVALILGEDGSALGILTDGNIRRAILAGKNLRVPVSEVMHRDPTVAPVFAAREELLVLMRRLSIHHIPLVEEGGRVVGLATLAELAGAAEHNNWVVLMAGGLGTRLQSLNSDLPKPLLPVGGTPILETILRSFVEQGFKRIFLAVNFKSEMIRDHFGDGSRWGVQVEYLEEPDRLGTAGALSLLPERPSEPIVVMNGDLLTRTNFGSLLQFHESHGSVATMAVREYDFQVPYGVVQIDGSRIVMIEEKPEQRFFVSAGIYVLSPEALDHLPPSTVVDMPTLFDTLIAAGKTTTAYPIREYWLDIGRVEEFERAQREWVDVIR